MHKTPALPSARRQRLLDHLHERPGAPFLDLCAAGGQALGATQYHLQRLEEDGHVYSRKAGRFRRYYAAGWTDASRLQADAELRLPMRAAVAHAYRTGAPTQRETASLLGVSRQTVDYHLRRLEAAGAARLGHAGRFLTVEVLA